MPLQTHYQQNAHLPSDASSVVWDFQCTVQEVSRVGILSGGKLTSDGQNSYLIIKGKKKNYLKLKAVVVASTEVFTVLFGTSKSLIIKMLPVEPLCSEELVVVSLNRSFTHY